MSLTKVKWWGEVRRWGAVIQWGRAASQDGVQKKKKRKGGMLFMSWVATKRGGAVMGRSDEMKLKAVTVWADAGGAGLLTFIDTAWWPSCTYSCIQQMQSAFWTKLCI